MKYYKVLYTSTIGREWCVAGKFKSLRSAKVYLETCQDVAKGTIMEYDGRDMNTNNWIYRNKTLEKL